MDSSRPLAVDAGGDPMDHRHSEIATQVLRTGDPLL
jgi:hypothetical protein